MKKTTILKKGLLTLAATVALGAVVLSVPTPFSGNSVVAYAAEETAEVSTIEEFEAALNNPEVSIINVNQSIQFTKNIKYIPNRDVTVNGNADLGVVINSANKSIYGKQNVNGKNTFSVKNANIVGADHDGRFFTGGCGNGPLSFGWDVYAENVTYQGARFVHLSEGKLTFAGTNDINTRAENAWVHDLEFAPGTVYNGVAANKDHGQYSGFYFNGSLVDGKTTGEVIIGDNAQVNVKIGPQSSKNYFYPVFYDKVQKVDVGQNASLDVDAAGVAFQFIARCDYVNKVPSLNLASKSKVRFNGRGGGDYATMKLNYCGSVVNVDRNAELVVTGDSSTAVVESWKDSTINITAPKKFEIANRRPNAKLFSSHNTTINATSVSRILTWGQLGGEYDTAATETFKGKKEFSVNFGTLCDSKTLGVTGSLTGDQEFKLENYGKVSLSGVGF